MINNLAWLGLAGSVAVRRGTAGEVRRGAVRLGKAGQCNAGKVRQVRERSGAACFGKATQAWKRLVRSAWLGLAGNARRGEVAQRGFRQGRLGTACSGLAGRGQLRQANTFISNT